MSQLQQKGQIHPSSAFLLYSGPQGAGCCPPALVGGLSLTQTTGSNANLFRKHPHRHAQKQCFTSQAGV